MNQETQQAINRVEHFAKTWRWQRDKQDIAAEQDGPDTCVVLAIADLEALIAERAKEADEETKRTRYVHAKTGGLYDVLHIATSEADGTTQIAVYRSVETGQVWARPTSEFFAKFAEAIVLEGDMCDAPAPTQAICAATLTSSTTER